MAVGGLGKGKINEVRIIAAIVGEGRIVALRRRISDCERKTSQRGILAVERTR